MSHKRNALGKGLSALLENSETDITLKPAENESQALAGTISQIPVSKIEANPFQPRSDFEQEALAELSASISALGIIQPVTVRKLGYDKYQLISGERRFRASQIAGLTSVPAYVRIANDQGMLEMALVENIQRSNLNPIEVAIGFKRLIDECNLTQEALGDRVGKNRSTVTNFLRLLKLPAEIQLALRNAQITMGHARSLINIEDPGAQMKVFREIISANLSVRNVEDYARKLSEEKGKKKRKAFPPSGSQAEKAAWLSSRLETDVALKPNVKGAGNIVIRYYSDIDFDRILNILQNRD